MQVIFKIQYWTEWGESLCLRLGGRRYPMDWNEGGVWSVLVKDCKAADLKSYDYVVMREGLVWRMEWKNHSSKLAKEIEDKWNECPIEGCPFPREHQAAKFDKPHFRGAGTAVPVFSLRSARDFGIGEFQDLHPLIDWAASTGQCIIQLLPVNDTTRKGEWLDSYPYSPISSFALHPLYMHLQSLGIKETAAFKKEQKALNSLSEVDYPAVFKAKMKYIRKAFQSRGEKDMESAAFKKFAKENEFWLEEYALFCAKRDGLEKEYYYWMQYHLDKQFAAEARYARSKGVSLKGDLPIGVSADSADAYWHPELFNLDSTAGAPPDFFSKDGQNWGFPTYNWEEMEKDNYAWWKARLKKMSEYFDASESTIYSDSSASGRFPPSAEAVLTVISTPRSPTRPRRFISPSCPAKACSTRIPAIPVCISLTSLPHRSPCPSGSRRGSERCTTTSSITVTTISGGAMPRRSFLSCSALRVCSPAERTSEWFPTA